MRIVLFLVFFYGHLYALDRESTLKIYHNLFSALTHHEYVKVYTTDPELRSIFAKGEKVTAVDDPFKSDVVVVSNASAYEQLQRYFAKNADRNRENLLIFATDYHLLKEHHDIVGALYWKKGRSQLLFLTPRLKRYHVTLPDSYTLYMVDTL